MIEHLLNQGAIIMHDIDDEGEVMYKITDKLQMVNPELYEDLHDQFEHHVMKIVDAGPEAMIWRINV